jgi:hypothetical protein
MLQIAVRVLRTNRKLLVNKMERDTQKDLSISTVLRE